MGTVRSRHHPWTDCLAGPAFKLPSIWLSQPFFPSRVSSPHRPHPGLIPSSPHAGSKKTASVYHISIQSCLAARLFFFFWHYFFVALFVFCLSSLDTGISPYWDCTLFFQLPAVLVTCSQVLSEQIKWKIPETKQLVLSLKLCSSQVVWWSLVLTPSIPPGVQTIHLLNCTPVIHGGHLGYQTLCPTISVRMSWYCIGAWHHLTMPAWFTFSSSKPSVVSPHHKKPEFNTREQEIMSTSL